MQNAEGIETTADIITRRRYLGVDNKYEKEESTNSTSSTALLHDNLQFSSGFRPCQMTEATKHNGFDDDV